MDLKKGYYQVPIIEGDEPKMTCVTQYGAFKWLVKPFGLTNALIMFNMLMNRVFHLYLDKFVVVHLDDIDIYNNMLEEYVEHLRVVFQLLRENQFYVKREKWTFATKEIHSLAHIIGHKMLRMDLSKLKLSRSENCQPR